ncbi:MAG: VWA domain-containing protein [Verrucomicrobiota bacterium]
MTIEFATPWVLWGIPFVVFYFLFFIWRKRRVLQRESAWHNIQQVTLGSEVKTKPNLWSRIRQLRKQWILLFVGLVLLFMALSRPQWGSKEEIAYKSVRDVMLALDLSRSMLAKDISPSRLARAKLMIQELLGVLRGERVGLVLFAGTAYVQSPLSSDYEILRDIVPTLEPDFLPQGGTDYGQMLQASLKGFNLEAPADRFLVVLSDGETLNEDWVDVLPTLKDNNVKVIGLGMGTKQGSLIELPGGGVVKNASGGAVLSRLEEKDLKKMADETGGVYERADRWVDIYDVVKKMIEQGKKMEIEEKRNALKIERFQYFLIPALLLLVLSLFLEVPRYPRDSEKLRRNLKEKYACLFWLLFLPAFGLAQMPNSQLQPNMPGMKLDPAQLQQMAQEQEKFKEDLKKVVKRNLVDSDDVSAKGWAQMAEMTLEFGNKQPTVQRGVVEDALKAVDVGQALDPGVADWDRLREELTKLLENKEQEQEQQDQNQQQDNKENQANDKDQQSNDSQQNQKNQDQQNQDQNSQEQQQQNQNSSQSDSQQNEQNASSQDKKDQQQNDPQQQNTSQANKDKKQDNKQSQDQPQQQQNQQKEDSSSSEKDAKQAKIPLTKAEQLMQMIENKDKPAVIFQRMNTGAQKEKSKEDDRNW